MRIQQINNRHRKLFILVGKVITVFLAYFYIAYRFQQYESIDFALNINSKTVFLFLLVVLLMPVNWFLESLKWKQLVSSFVEIGILKSLRGVFAGITIAIFTPNRIGELFGRAIVLEKEHRVQAGLATGIGSILQLSVTIILGLFSIIFFLIIYENPFSVEKLDFFSVFLIFVAFSIFLGILFAFYKLKKIYGFLLKFKIFRKHKGKIIFIKNYSKKELLRIWILSFFRYLIFTVQFFILLMIFEVDIKFYEAFIGISSVYFVSALIPTITLAELGIRGSAAITFLSYFSQNEAGILAASFLIWIINVAFAALIGSFFVYKAKI